MTCQVWFADLGAELPEHVALLDPVEQNRRTGYRRAADRSRFTVAAALLRLVVADQTGIDPGAVQVDRSCRRCGAPHGKPHIRNADLHVSISHSGDKVALALCHHAPVGVDVETIAERDITGLSRKVLTAAEVVGRPEDFYTYWCRKEAVVKATGDGLRVPLTQVVVSPAGAPARLISYQGAPLSASLRDLPADPGYAAAVAVLAEGELEVRVHDAAGVMSVAGD